MVPLVLHRTKFVSARGGLEQILDINNLIPLLRNLRILDPIRLVCFITIRICFGFHFQFRCEGCIDFKLSADICVTDIRCVGQTRFLYTFVFSEVCCVL